MVEKWGGHRLGPPHSENKYFTDFTIGKGILYFVVVCYVIGVCIACVLQLFIPFDDCDKSALVEHHQIQFPNPLYDENPCRHLRVPRLLYLTPDECSFGRRLISSVVLGGVVGWERRQADRPAGIRTMALVSLGSCLFSITSALAFLYGPMGWDSSRVAAAIPSGVGFLGAGLIFKESQKHEKTGETNHIVHGLTTSASLWISAAVGVACSGELYFCATFSVALILTLLRFGPRGAEHRQDDDDDNMSDDGTLEEQLEKGYGATRLSGIGQSMASLRNRGEISDHPSVGSLTASERMKLFGTTKRKTPQRAALGGVI